MNEYNFIEIEKRWQEKWEQARLNEALTNDVTREKFYSLETFPYPSGAGLHVGHSEGYTAEDINARFSRMNGKNVLYSIGWDAFGLPTENYAIQVGKNPKEVASLNIINFTRQLKMFGFSYDWNREINTSDPSYYRWTQWLFLQFYKRGLAYRHKAPVNWCSSCKTVLAREQVVDGNCERCKNIVTQRLMEQWFFRITNYAEELLSGLDELDWPESTKEGQRNWIGKSEGARVVFAIHNSKVSIEVFTTRPDTLFGVTYMIVAPLSALVDSLMSRIENADEVARYRVDVSKKTELERAHLEKEKTGVCLQGILCVHPITHELIPVWIADYVLESYGTGMIMAVPAHDERDYAFAQKFNLPIHQTLCVDSSVFDATELTLNALDHLNVVAEREGIMMWIVGGLACAFHVGFVYRKHADIDVVVRTHEEHDRLVSALLAEKYTSVREKAFTKLLKSPKGIEIEIGAYHRAQSPFQDEDFSDEKMFLNGHYARVVSRARCVVLKQEQLDVRQEKKDALDMRYLNGEVMKEGVVVQSDFLNGLTSIVACETMILWLGQHGTGKRAIEYRLRDWLVSRQRYWGAPIPMIWCTSCGVVPVAEEDLPILLPDDVDFTPTGEPPLASSSEFATVICPTCGGSARRDYETMDTFVDSSWYFLRYCSPQEKDRPFNRADVDFWLPIDLYVIGAEHIALHLLYARFFTKACADMDLLTVREPFKKMRHQGLILGNDGQKMSKSRGNVVNPDEVVKEYGADALRLFLMFMGPLSESKPWSIGGIKGISRFLEKVWRISGYINDDATNETTKKLLHKTIQIVTADFKEMRYNTLISRLMILLNEWIKVGKVARADFEIFLKLLHPLAPHITEELWHIMGNESYIMTEKWPEYNPQLTVDAQVLMVIQVNGKVRAKQMMDVGLSENGIKEIVFQMEKISELVKHKIISNVIVVKDKLVNIVTKETY